MGRPVVRIVPLILLLVLWVPSARAWTWPVAGPVLQGFSFDRAHPYAGGQHRGVDIGAAGGDAVLAPAAGVVSFAGTVPTSGTSVTIETPDGLSVTLTHLGSLAVARNAAVAEGAALGTVGPSGTPEVDGPYVHLGVRTTADDQGYLDPLGLLPVLPLPVPALSPPAPPVAAPAPANAPASSEPPVQAASPVETSAPVATAPPGETAPVLPETVVAAPPAPSAVAAPLAPSVAEPPVAEQPSPVRPADAATSAQAVEAPVEEALAPHGEHRSTTEPELLPGLERLALPGSLLPHSPAARLRVAPAATPPGRVHPFVRAATPASIGTPTAVRVPAIDTAPPSTGTAPSRGMGTHASSATAEAVHRPRSLAPLVLALLVIALLVIGGLVAGGVPAVRIIRSPSPTSEGARPVAVVTEDPRRARVAVREWASPHRPRGGVRRARGRVRALSPAERQRRPDGQRDGRARHTGDGVRRPERRIAA